MKFSLLALIAAAMFSTAVQAAVVDDLLNDYRAQGAGPFDAKRGQQMWRQTHPAPDGGAARMCATCHTEDLRKTGKHARTGKAIEPLAPSINSERLSVAADVEKWFRRNCKWVMGRECSVQEKGDYLSFIRMQ